MRSVLVHDLPAHRVQGWEVIYGDRNAGSDGIPQHLVQVIANAIDFGMDISDAITAPRMRVGGSIDAGTQNQADFYRGRQNSGGNDGCAAREKVTRSDRFQGPGPLAESLSIHQPGFRLGGADPREDGYALGS